MKSANSLYVVAIAVTRMANRIGIGIVKSSTVSHGIGAGVWVGIADPNGCFVRSAGASIFGG